MNPTKITTLDQLEAHIAALKAQGVPGDTPIALANSGTNWAILRPTLTQVGVKKSHFAKSHNQHCELVSRGGVPVLLFNTAIPG